MNEDEPLKVLETLMVEFFNGNTTNERKYVIQDLLNSFGQQDESLNLCLKYLMATQNEYTIMYCLSVLENFILKKWSGLGSMKLELRQFLYSYLLSHKHPVPNYVKNKTAKLIVDIGRLDWPHQYPDFPANIYQIIHGKETTYLGLILLQTCIEELTSTRDDLSSNRKDEINKLLLGQVPQMLSILGTLMESILDKHVNFVTATPPPSPTHTSNGPFGSDGDLLNNVFELSLRRGILHSVPSIDAESYKVAVASLNSLTQLFAWIPHSQYQQISNSLLAAVFLFATFGSSNKKVETNSMSRTDISQLGILAMNCINEIMSKNFVSNDAADFFYNLFQNTFQLLQNLMREDGNNILIDNLDDDYVGKFTDFLRIFISNHFQRYETQESFPVLEFLALVFQFTFKQNSCDRFLLSLDVWSLFTDYVSLKKKQRDPVKGTVSVDKYKSILVSLMSEITNKLQYKYNRAVLENMDANRLDEDTETDWQTFLHQCIELIAKISEIIPFEAYSLINTVFEENLTLYLGLECWFTKDAHEKSNKLELNSNDNQRLHSTLKDLSTLLKIVGRLSVNFTSEHFLDRLEVSSAIYQKLIKSLKYSNSTKPFSLQVVNNVLTKDFIEVHSEIFATVQAFSYWLVQFNNEASERLDEFNHFVTSITINCVEAICNEEIVFPQEITHSAALCLLSLTSNVRPKILSTLPSFQSLYRKVCSSVQPSSSLVNPQYSRKFLNLSVSYEDEIILYKIISNTLLLPWPNINDTSQEWNSRSVHHKTFIDALIAPLKNSAISNPSIHQNPSSRPEFENLLKQILPIINKLVQSHSESSSRSKQILFQNLKELIEFNVKLFPIFFPHSEVGEDFLILFHTIFDVLRAQIKMPFIEETVNMMLNLFGQNNIAGDIVNERSTGCRIAEKLLKILTFIVRQPGLFKSMLHEMLSLVLNQIYPFIRQTFIPDVTHSFYEFLFQFLLNNFKYFFKSTLLNSIKQTNNCSLPPTEEVDHQNEFILLMQAYGESFLQSDISLFKQNLNALETLNFRLKLYQKQIFITDLSNSFLNLFMEMLISKSHEILQEEIITILYNISSVNFDNFFHQFLPQFLYRLQGLNDNQKQAFANSVIRNNARDLPSFSQNMIRLVNDIRYYKLCNG